MTGPEKCQVRDNLGNEVPYLDVIFNPESYELGFSKSKFETENEVF